MSVVDPVPLRWPALVSVVDPVLPVALDPVPDPVVPMSDRFDVLPVVPEFIVLELLVPLAPLLFDGVREDCPAPAFSLPVDRLVDGLVDGLREERISADAPPFVPRVAEPVLVSGAPEVAAGGEPVRDGVLLPAVSPVWAAASVVPSASTTVAIGVNEIGLFIA